MMSHSATLNLQCHINIILEIRIKNIFGLNLFYLSLQKFTVKYVIYGLRNYTYVKSEEILGFCSRIYMLRFHSNFEEYLFLEPPWPMNKSKGRRSLILNPVTVVGRWLCSFFSLMVANYPNHDSKVEIGYGCTGKSYTSTFSLACQWRPGNA